MSYSPRFVAASRIRRAWIAVALLLVGMIVVMSALTAEDTSAQIVERSVSAGGLIAYSNANHEIWVSAPDGNNARKLWEVPQAYRGSMVSGITNLSWNKDGSMLAFVSGHEPHCSWYETNIYVVNVDGSGFRRITNRPSCEDAATLPVGSVSVTVRNDFNEVMSVEVTVEGAPQPTFVTLLPRVSREVIVPDVPDLGEGLPQNVVGIEGGNRWLSTNVDVVAGQTVNGGELVISAAGRVNNVTVWNPTWSPDSQTIAFLLSGRLMQRVAVDGGNLQRSSDLLSGGAQTIAAGELAWSPVDNTVLFTANNTDGGRSVFRAEVGADAVTGVVTVDDTRGLAWLPDGSGFVMANWYEEFVPVHGNLWHIDLVNNQATQLTTFENEFAIRPSVSPDGQQIVFVHDGDLNDDAAATLQIVSINGGASAMFGPGDIAVGWPAWAADGGTVNPTPTATPAPPTATPTTPSPTATPVSGGDTHKVYLPYAKR